MKIAVLGSASSSLPKAPFQNDAYAAWVQGRCPRTAQSHAQVGGEWDIWGCSPGCWAVIPRATRWFEVHRWEPGQQWLGPEYCQFLRDFKGIVYTGGRIPEIPNHVIYPIDRLEEKFSSYFMTSSLALMMALAIDTIEQIRDQRRAAKEGKSLLLVEGMKREAFEAELEKTDEDDVIGMWGVDMAAHEEYAYQRPGCQFFILEAMRRGIGVYLPPESDLMRPMPVYGISEWDHNYIKLTSRARELNQRIQEAQANMQQANTQISGLQGEMAALNHFVSTWTNPYGMLPGMVIRQAEGTGLGSGITTIDARPIERMTLGASQADVVQAMAEPPEPARLRIAVDIMEALRPHAGETGLNEGAVETVQRLGREGAVGRTLTAHLQQFARAGESTEDTLRRIMQAAVQGVARGKKKRRR